MQQTYPSERGLKKVHELYIYEQREPRDIQEGLQNGKLIIAEVPAKFKERFERTKLQNNLAEDVIILG